MKISLDWLKDYIETKLSAEEIAETLSDLGFPCEGVEHVDGDTVIDVEITSNRGDCLGLIGVARELAAVTGAKLKTPVIEAVESDKQVGDFVSVEIAEPKLCCRYTARIIEGVKAGPSPDWMVKRLEAVGIRSVNNIVDATNYAMMETGQPPHAFDYEKIAGGKIVARKAAAGESLVSIDGTKCELTADTLVIADERGPVAIAGVMGGLDSEVSETTTTILLEDAWFDPVSVRTSSRRLGLPSESSFRFERVVDIDGIDSASMRTAQLIIQVAGGRMAKGVVDVYPNRKSRREVVMRLSRLKRLLGIEVPIKEVMTILSRLGFEPKQNGETINCTVAFWRNDVCREVDLIEEIARVYGYDKIPTQQKIQIEVAAVDKRWKLTEATGEYLNGCGFYETINVSFIDDSVAKMFGGEENGHLAVKDVTRKSANLLRQSLVGSLLAVMRTNFNAGNRPCRVFEIADTFVPADGEPLPVEKTKLAIACDCEFRLMRGVIEGLIENIDRTARVSFEAADVIWAQHGADIKLNGKTIGEAGLVSGDVKNKFDIKEDVEICCAELDFETLLSMQLATVKVKQIPRYPAIDRDLSLILEEKTSWVQIVEAVHKASPDELESISFVSIYRGRGIEQGKKSLTLSLRFRDKDGTLMHENVDRFQAGIVGQLESELGAELRTA